MKLNFSFLKQVNLLSINKITFDKPSFKLKDIKEQQPNITIRLTVSKNKECFYLNSKSKFPF